MKRIVVAVLAAGAFAALCWDASTRLANHYPSIGMCFHSPQKHIGKRVWIAANPVLGSEAYSFDVLSYETPVRIHSAMRPTVGTYVMVYGTFQSDLSVLALRTREEPAYPVKRMGVYIVSFIVLAVGAFVFHRTFVWRDGAFHPR